MIYNNNIQLSSNTNLFNTNKTKNVSATNFVRTCNNAISEKNNISFTGFKLPELPSKFSIKDSLKTFINNTFNTQNSLINLLNTKLTNSDILLDEMRTFCQSTYQDAIQNFTKPNKKFSFDITPFTNKLAAAKNSQEIFELESKFFEQLNNWSKNTINNNEISATAKETSELTASFLAKLKNKSNELKDKTTNELTLNDIPTKLTKNKKAKKLLAEYEEAKQQRITLINQAENYTAELFTQDAKAYLADKFKIRSSVIRERIEQTNIFLEAIKNKLDINNSEIAPKTNQKNTTESKLLPQSISQDILSNPIFKFITNQNITKQDYKELISNMSALMNLNDIQILSKRLELRAMSTQAKDFEKMQLRTLADKCMQLNNNCEIILDKIFLESGQSINLEHTDIPEAEVKMLKLSEKYGYKTIGEMISKMLIKNNHNPTIYNSNLYKIYSKHKQEFLENTGSIELAISRGNNDLFKWGTI